jgi:glycosyltransferase involved in cell wall biosynthesis
MPSSPPDSERSNVSLSVVVPAYREGPTIYKAIGVLLESLHSLDRSYEVLVVSDGNDDETVEEAARHGEPVFVLHYEMRRGKGYALRYGISRARGEYIAFIDADMELHPDGLGPLLALVDGGADAAIGSKRHPDSQVYYPFVRRVQSAAYQRLIRVLFDLDVMDTQTGIKVFRGPLLRESLAHISSDGFAFDLELLVVLRQHGARIAEGPVQLDYRFATTTGIRAVLDVMRDTWRIFRRHRKAGDRRP